MGDFSLHPIRTEDGYRVAVAEASRLFNLPHEPDVDSAESAYADALVTLIKAYEHKHFAVDASDPIDTIKYQDGPAEPSGCDNSNLTPIFCQFLHFAKFKALLRRASARTIEALWQRIGELLDEFSAQECANYF